MESTFYVYSGSHGDFMAGSGEGQPAKTPRLMEQMRAVLRVQRYALRTEVAYCDWVRRFIKFHGMKSRADLADGARKVEDFLTHLAVVNKVAASTQNQAFNALLFLYDRVLEQPLGERVDAVRATHSPRVPMVFMCYVYVLQSETDDGLHLGFSTDLRRRTKEDRAGKSFATSYRGPWRLIY